MTKSIKYWLVTLLFFLSLGLTFERPAHAYVDPGSCLLLFQSLGAVASGVLFYFRRRLKRVFTRGQSAGAVPAAPTMSRVASKHP